MKYYRAKGEYHDYFTWNTTIPGELVTERERNTKYRYLADHVFEPVLCSRRDTYISFGARKAYTDAKITLL